MPGCTEINLLSTGFSCRIDSQDLHELSNFPQVMQRVSRCLFVPAKNVDKEDIFPGMSAHGARLDLTQTDIAQRKDTKRFEQCTGNILQCESDGRLIGAAANLV